MFGHPQAAYVEMVNGPWQNLTNVVNPFPVNLGGSFQVLPVEGGGVASGGWYFPQPRRSRLCFAERDRCHEEGPRLNRSCRKRLCFYRDGWT